MSFNNTQYEEQETIVNIDYYNSKMYIYTSRKITFERLKDKLGKPSKEYLVNKKISGGRWEIGFNEKRKITSVLSRPLLIGSVK